MFQREFVRIKLINVDILQRPLSMALLVVSLLGGTCGAEAEQITSEDARQIAQQVTDVAAIRTNSVDGLTRDIVCKEIELLKLDTNYRLYHQTTMLRRRLVALVSTAAYSTADAGNIVTFATAFHFKNIPQYLHVGKATSGPFLIMLGECIFLGRTVGEAAADLFHAQYVKAHGFDRQTFEARGEKLLAEVGSLLAARQAAANAAGDAVAIQEQAVLQDLADLETREFAREFARGKMREVKNISRAITENCTSGTGFAGGILIRSAAARSRPRIVGPSGLCFIASGTSFITSQLVMRHFSQKAKREVEAKILAGKTLSPEQQLSNDKEKLASMTVGNASAIERRKTYDVMQAMLDKQLCLNQIETKEEFHKFLHDQFINTIEGGANIAAGSILAKAGFGFRTGVGFSQLTNARHFLDRYAKAAVTFTPSATGGLIDTPGEQIYAEHRERQKCKQDICETVALNNRLTVLDAAQKTFE